MLLDPLAGRIDYDRLGAMTDEMLAATKRGSPSSRPPDDPRDHGRRAARARPPRSQGARRGSGAARGDRRRSRHRGSRCRQHDVRHRQLAARLPRRARARRRRRLVARDRLPHGRVRRYLPRPSRELPALHARTARRAGADLGVPLHRGRRRRHRCRVRAVRGAPPRAPARSLLPRHRRERAPRVQRPARRRLRRPARREGRRARRGLPSAAGGRRPLPDVDAVPTHAITVTIPSLVHASTVLAIVPEARKAEPVRRALAGPIATTCPASVLRTRPNATLYLDAESAALVA